MKGRAPTTTKTAPETRLPRPGSLVGLWFHSFTADGLVSWQGQVIDQLADGLLVVELYEWFVGAASCLRVVPVAQTVGWQLYTSNEWMNNTYEHGGLKARAERAARRDDDEHVA